MSDAICINNVSFAYPESPWILENINLHIPDGEFLGIVGPSGGGKTTLLKLILGLLKPQQGNIQIFGKPPETAKKNIGYVSQFHSFSRRFPISVESVVFMGRLGNTKVLGGYTSRDRQIVDRVLHDLDICQLRERPMGSLSGGQLQRVLLARALAAEPRILFLDEPTTSLDPHSEEATFELLGKLNQKVTIILVSHDIGFISHYIKRVACINRTLVCHPASEISPKVLHDLYGAPVSLIAHGHVSKGGRHS